MSSSQAGTKRSAADDVSRFEAELADQLLCAGDLQATDLDTARKVQARTGSRLTTALLDLGMVPAPPPPPPPPQLQQAPTRPAQEELISEGAFETLYQSDESALPPAGRARPLGPGEVRAPVQRDLPPLTNATPAAPPRAAATRPDAASPLQPPAPAQAENPSRDAHPLPPVPGIDAAVEAPAATPATEELELRETVGQWSGEASGPILTPSLLAEARGQLAAARDRKEVGWVLARHALGKAPRVVVLGRRGRAWVGWAGAGQGIRSERVERLVVPPVPGTVFGLVASTGGPYLGPLAEHPVHERFFRTLDIERAASLALFPVYHDGEIEMALYLDPGPGGRLSPDVGDVLLIAQEVPRTLARLAAKAND
jgi:hypothetical protein